MVFVCLSFIVYRCYHLSRDKRFIDVVLFLFSRKTFLHYIHSIDYIILLFFSLMVFEEIQIVSFQQEIRHSCVELTKFNNIFVVRLRSKYYINIILWAPTIQYEHSKNYISKVYLLWCAENSLLIMDNESAKVNKLTGPSYWQQWKLQMRIIMILCELFNITTGKSKKSTQKCETEVDVRKRYTVSTFHYGKR